MLFQNFICFLGWPGVWEGSVTRQPKGHSGKQLEANPSEEGAICPFHVQPVCIWRFAGRRFNCVGERMPWTGPFIVEHKPFPVKTLRMQSSNLNFQHS